jgi:sugar lactone lactonase YvrE
VPVLSSVRPKGAVPGARVTLLGARLSVPRDGPPLVTVGDPGGLSARVVSASSRAISIVVPEGTPGGPQSVRLAEAPGESVMLNVAHVVTTDVHQVDSPVCTADGSLYVTHSGGRDTKAPVPMYRVRPDGTREPIAVDIANPTSLALAPDGSVFVSSRFEGQVYRLTSDDRAELYATDLGVATGLACAGDGTLFVGDRSGTILRISAGQSGESARHVDTYASLPASVAAFHLAIAPDGCLYVTAPTLASHDVVYRITPAREVQVVCAGFGRPQGLACDASGALFVTDALAGASGLYRVDLHAASPVPELVIAAPHLVGVAFGAAGEMYLASHDTVWRI